jgi:hypothetical protein
VSWLSLKETKLWAIAAHGTQFYGGTKTDDGGMDGNHPFSFHLNKVDDVLIRFGFYTEYGIREGGQLHDVFEDTLKRVRDALAAGIVLYAVMLAWACTDGRGKSRREKKRIAFRKIRSTPDAVIVKYADRIANFEHAVLTGNLRKVLMYLGEMKEFEEALQNAPVSKPEYQPKLDAMRQHLRLIRSADWMVSNWGKVQCCGRASELPAKLIAG